MRYFIKKNADGEIIELRSSNNTIDGWEEISRTTWMILRLILRIEIMGEDPDALVENQTWYDQPMI